MSSTHPDLIAHIRICVGLLLFSVSATAQISVSGAVGDTILVKVNDPKVITVLTANGDRIEGILHSATVTGIRIQSQGIFDTTLAPEDITSISISEHGSFWWPLLHGYAAVMTAAMFAFSLTNSAYDQTQALGIYLFGGFIAGPVGLLAAGINMIIQWPREWNIKHNRVAYSRFLRSLQDIALWQSAIVGEKGQLTIIDYEEADFDPVPPSHAFYHEIGLVDLPARLMSYSFSTVLSQPFETVLSNHSRLHGEIGITGGIVNFSIPIACGMLFGKSKMLEINAGLLVNVHTNTADSRDDSYRRFALNKSVTGYSYIGYRYQSPERIFRVGLSPRFFHSVLPNISISYGWSW